jgi:aryl-alcohol dehydrogenase-like predicted oxidoreductase
VNPERGWACVDAMRTIAERQGVSVAQVALAWLLHQPVVTSVIVGAKRVDQLDDNIAATAVTLSAEELAQLDKVSALPAEYPGWMLERQGGSRRKQMAQ